MCVMSTPKTRLERLNRILELLKANKGKMAFKELYGNFALEVTLRTFWGYLDTLRLAGKISYPEIYLANREEEIEIKALG